MKINNLKMFLYIFKIYFYFRKFVTGHIEYFRGPYVAREPWVGHYWYIVIIIVLYVLNFVF
jgi:hypothetical protein